MRRRAARLHRGNVSAVIAELAEDARSSESIAQLVETGRTSVEQCRHLSQRGATT